MALLLLVVRKVSFGVSRSAASGIHWRDPALLTAEAREAQVRAQLEAMERTLAPQQGKGPEAERLLAERSEGLRRAVLALQGTWEAGGPKVLERPPVRSSGRWRTTSVRVAAGKNPTGLRDFLANLSIPEGAWVEAVRCDARDCSVLLSAAALEPRAPSRPFPQTRRDLPPRPWWPPSAAVWDRVQEALKDNERRGKEIESLWAIKQVQDDAMLIEFLVLTGRSEVHRAAVGELAARVRAAGLVGLEVRRDKGGFAVEVPSESASLRERLTDLGQTWLEGSSQRGATLRISPFRGRGGAIARDDDLPPGFSTGY